MEKECDDSPASTSSYLTLGGSTGWGFSTGALHSHNDNDWFAVALKAGVEYEFAAYGSLYGGGTATDIVVKNIYNSTGAKQDGFHTVEADPLIHDEETETTYRFRQKGYFTPAAAGTFYLEVAPRDFAGTSGG